MAVTVGKINKNRPWALTARGLVLPPVADGGTLLSVSSHSAAGPLIRKLESIITLSDEEREALTRLPMQVVEIGADQDIVREGDRPSRSALVLDGTACSYKVMEDGKRQILALYITGDVPDLHSLHLDVLDYSVGTLTPCKFGFIPHEALNELNGRYPRLANAFWRNTLIDGAIFRALMTSVGRRSAYTGMAHLICELLLRFRAVGLTRDDSFELPITQQEIADVLGLSAVHANRTLQELRGSGLIHSKNGLMIIQDWEKLKQAANFDPSYLHLKKGEPAA